MMEFPNVEKSNGLISDSDKEALSLLGIQLSRTAKDMISDERVVYKSLFRLRKIIFILPLTDNTGEEYPSFIIEQVEEMFDGDLRFILIKWEQLITHQL